MRVAVVHYHLRRGGVTSVMATTARALRQAGVDVVFVAGEPPAGALGFPCVIDAALGYGGDEQPEALYRRIVDRAGGVPDLWHIHNHALGKNRAVPRLVRYLAACGERLLLHVHDFAEDFRAANYQHLRALAPDPAALQAFLYPVGDHVRYATLTKRDAAALIAAGIPPANVDVFPNPVAAPVVAPAPRPHTAGEKIYVYSVRGIRRKNIGELLLWAARGEGNDRFVLTLPPTSAVDAGPYEAWKSLAAALKLPLEFEAGANRPYEEILEQADALITTSIAEGFGLAFAEPWLAGKPLVGRRLDGVVRDLEAEGLCFSGLYDQLLVPLDWVDCETLREVIRQRLRKLYRDYEIAEPPDASERAWRTMTRGDAIDFGRLDEAMQGDVLREAVRRGFPGRLEPDAGMIKHNAAVVRERLCPARYAARLGEVYNRLASEGAGPVEGARGALITSRFLQPENLYLLRTMP